MASYLGNSPDVILQVRKRNYRYVATGGQNTFSGNDSNGQSLYVNIADVEVFLNGVLLDQTDYTITSTQLQLTLNAALDDIVEVITNTTFATADQYSKQEVDSKVAAAVTDLVGTAGTALNTLGELSDALNDDANYAATITTALGTKANTSSLATVATSGSYDDLTNKPTIPTVSATAVSDQNNTSTGYFKIPVGTTAQRPASPSSGMIRFNSSRNTFEYYNSPNWLDVSTDLSAFTDITSLSMPHSSANTTEAGGTTAISTYGSAAVSQDSTSAGFGMHDGHDGSPADWPAYAAIYIGGTYPAGKAVNKLTLSLHGNSFGHFELQGSNDASTSGTFYNTGNWTSLTFTSAGSSHSIQNAGGYGSGYGDGTVLTFRYNNNVPYTHYRLWIKDNSQVNEAVGTRYGGWATYFWTLERV
jgi:hypothetical protein